MKRFFLILAMVTLSGVWSAFGPTVELATHDPNDVKAIVAFGANEASASHGTWYIVNWAIYENYNGRHVGTMLIQGSGYATAAADLVYANLGISYAGDWVGGNGSMRLWAFAWYDHGNYYLRGRVCAPTADYCAVLRTSTVWV